MESAETDYSKIDFQTHELPVEEDSEGRKFVTYPDGHKRYVDDLTAGQSLSITTVPPSLEKKIEAAINRHSAENGSDTPDFILAQYLTGCMEVFNRTVKAREKWYGRVPVEVEGPIEEITDTNDPPAVLSGCGVFDSEKKRVLYSKKELADKHTDWLIENYGRPKELEQEAQARWFERSGAFMDFLSTLYQYE